MLAVATVASQRAVSCVVLSTQDVRPMGHASAGVSLPGVPAF